MVKTTTHYENPAVTDYPIHDLIRRRWSARAFDPRPIEAEKLLSILEAARWAASSRNRQPWRFIIAPREAEQDFADMLAVLKEGNQLWAQNAGVLGIAVAELQTEDGSVNRHAEHDTGMALAHIALQAVEYDLHIRMMGGFYPDKAREFYNIPENFTPLTAFALGYHGDPELLPEDKRNHESPRSRRPLAETVFAGGWTQTAPLVSDRK